MSPQAVSKWEKDSNAPDILQLVKLGALFGVSTDYLLGVHDEKQGTFEATVFYSSLRDFAQRSTRMDSKDLADRTNALFHALTETVLAYDGIPVKYVGDGFLCFFSGASHADRAAQAALRSKKIAADPALVIALHSGDIYFGAIGHRDYQSRDILGETVNRVFLVTPWIAKRCAGGIGITTEAVTRLGKKFALGKTSRVYLAPVRSTAEIAELKN